MATYRGLFPQDLNPAEAERCLARGATIDELSFDFDGAEDGRFETTDYPSEHPLLQK